LRQAPRHANGKLLIVLDQFEEFVILGEPAAAAGIAELITDQRSNPIRGVPSYVLFAVNTKNF